jgi:hypothetical protein
MKEKEENLTWDFLAVRLSMADVSATANVTDKRKRKDDRVVRNDEMSEIFWNGFTGVFALCVLL